MEGMMILKAMLSLAFVLGLMFLTLWAVRYCQLHGAKSRFMRKLGEQQRLQVLEVRRRGRAEYACFVPKRQRRAFGFARCGAEFVD